MFVYIYIYIYICRLIYIYIYIYIYCRLDKRRRISDYVEWIQKCGGASLDQRHDDRMMAILFAADMVSDCKQRGVQRYSHWHGPRTEEAAPKTPKAMCRIAHEFLPQIRSEGGALGSGKIPNSEETVDDQGQEPQQSKRPCQTLPVQSRKNATNAPARQDTGSRKRPLSSKNRDRQQRPSSSNNFTRHIKRDGDFRNKSSQEQKGSEWTPTIRQLGAVRQRSREPRGDRPHHKGAGKADQPKSHQSKRTSQSSYSPQSRFFDIRKKSNQQS